MRLAD
jgi:hypothetical protein